MFPMKATTRLFAVFSDWIKNRIKKSGNIFLFAIQLLRHDGRHSVAAHCHAVKRVGYAHCPLHNGHVSILSLSTFNPNLLQNNK